MKLTAMLCVAYSFALLQVDREYNNVVSLLPRWVKLPRLWLWKPAQNVIKCEQLCYGAIHLKHVNFSKGHKKSLLSTLVVFWYLI